MTILKIIDLEVALPENTSISVAPPEATREVRILEGAFAASLATAVEATAIGAGFALGPKSARDTLLRRGEQAIDLFQRTDSSLVVRVEDPSAFPVARVSGTGIQIHDVDLVITADEILPGRERHVEGTREWSAEWTVFGPSAVDLSGQLQDAFVALGLRANGVWAPPEGTNRWKVEAYSVDRLMQAEVFSKPDRCELKIHLVTS